MVKVCNIVINMWKVIDNFPKYSISDNGKVKRNRYEQVDSMGRTVLYKEKELRLYKDKDGYSTVMLRNEKGHVKMCKVHRLVAEAFIDNKENYKFINHKNENKSDNRKGNLEWCDIKYNNTYNGRHIIAGITQRKRIYSIDKNGNIIHYNGVCEAAKSLNVKGCNISSALNGKLKTAYGYKWFKEVI